MRIVLATICCRFWSWGLVKNFCSDFEHKVWSRFWSWSSGKICNWSLATFLRWYFLEVMKLNLGRDFEARFGQDFEVLWRGWCLVETLKLMLGRDSEDATWSRFLFELLIWTQPSGPLCLWQCSMRKLLIEEDNNEFPETVTYQTCPPRTTSIISISSAVTLVRSR